MLTWLNNPVNPSILIAVAALYQIISSINMFDIRYDLPYSARARLSNLKTIPKSFLFLHWSETILIVFLFLLNWKFALVTWLIKSILKAFYVLEFIGYMILYAFNSRL